MCCSPCCHLLASGFSGTLSLCFSSDYLSLYLGQWNAGILNRITVSSGAVATVATGLSAPEGITLAGDGLSVYVSEGMTNGFISQITLATGARTTIATGFNAPSDSVLSVDATTLYVSEWCRARARTRSPVPPARALRTCPWTPPPRRYPALTVATLNWT